MALARGTAIGPYEVVALLGSGGMGEVYGTRDTRLDRFVAVKIISPSLAAQPDALARFEREARAASALNHPNILHIYDVGRVKLREIELPYMAMEYVEGVTLSRKIHFESTSLPKLLEWLAQVADGLAKAHGAGIVHRDLKPDNIMISQDGYAKILDFGLAKLVERIMPVSSDGNTLVRSPESSSGVVLGTVGYISPEQALGEVVDHRADVFSFGCVLYEAVTRRRAFDGDSAVDTLHKIIYSPPVPALDDLDLPDPLHRLLTSCLEKEPKRRIDSMKEVSKTLRALSSSDLAQSDFSRGGSGPTHRRSASSSGRQLPTVAVLPFDDISPAHDNDYFSDGLTEEIISDLSKIRSMRVISRASVMKFKGSQKNIRAISRELGATYVLDGSVRKAGMQLRISAQLIDAANEANVWSEKYSGTLDDIFDIQERVARSIAEELRVKVSPEEIAQLAERPIPDVRAYEFYLRARKHVMNLTSEGMSDALRELAEAEKIIGEENALLQSARGYIYWQYYNAGIDPDPRNLDCAEELAKRILSLDPSSHHGHRLLGLVLSQRNDIQQAVRHLKQAISIDPNDPDSLAWLAILYAVVGHPSQAEALVRRVVTIDPLSLISNMTPIIVWTHSGRFDKAVDAAAKAFRLDPTNAIVQWLYATSLFHAQRYSEAFALIDRVETPVDHPFGRMTFALSAAIQTEADEVRRILDESTLSTMRADPQYSVWVAEIYALIGDKDAAIDWLSHAVSRGFVPYRYLNEFDPLLKNIRDDARFEYIMTRAKVASEAFEI